MKRVSIQSLQKAKKSIFAQGYTIKGWSRGRGFSPSSVHSLLNGHDQFKYQSGKMAQKILRQLEQEGLLQIIETKRRAA